MSSAKHKIIIFLAFAGALSGCSGSTSFNKLLGSDEPQNSHSNVNPAPSPSISSTPSPVSTPPVTPPPAQPIQPPLTKKPTTPPLATPPMTPPKAPSTPPPVSTQTPAAVDLQKIHGDYESADGELQIATDNTFFMRLKEVSSLKAAGSNPEQYAYCTFERHGEIQSITVVNNQTVMNLKVLSEKLDASMAIIPNSDAEGICSAVSTALSEESSFSIKIIGSGAGYLSIAWERKNPEQTADSLPSNGKLGSLFVDPTSAIDITQILFATIGEELVGSYGSRLETDTVPRLQMQWNAGTQTLAFSDNECGFAITSKLQALDTSGRIFLTSVGTPQVKNPLVTVAANSYSVYFGRKSSNCSTREHAIDNELTHFEVGFVAQDSNGTYGVSYDSGIQYLVRAK